MLTVSRAGDGEQLWRLTVARSFMARLRGLMGRAALNPGQGIYLPGSNGVHMLFMRFAIDCVFVGGVGPDGARRVVAVRHNLAPWTGIVWWVRGARGAIEVGAGEAALAQLKPGDALLFAEASGPQA